MVVRLIPRDVLEAEARAWHGSRHPEPPEPAIINIDAVLTIGQSREFQWGAIKLHAPPLSFPLGARLYVAAGAMRDLRLTNASPQSIKAAQRVAAALIRQAVKPASNWSRLRCWHCTFTTDEPEQIEGLLRWLLLVPDAAHYQEPTKKVVIDFMDAVAAFAKAFPAWMKDGWPLSWAHYQYGTRHLIRAAAREELRAAVANRVGQAEKQDFKQYVTEQSVAAGWN